MLVFEIHADVCCRSRRPYDEVAAPFCIASLYCMKRNEDPCNDNLPRVYWRLPVQPKDPEAFVKALTLAMREAKARAKAAEKLAPPKNAAMERGDGKARV